MIVLNDKWFVVLCMALFFAGIMLAAYIDDRIQRRKRSEEKRKDFHTRQRLRDNTKYYNFGDVTGEGDGTQHFQK